MNNTGRRYTLKIALIAILAALIIGGKFVLSFIPNVEIVSLIIIITTVSLGLTISLPVIIVFVTIETLIYGFGYWSVAYMIYWPLLSIVVYLFNRIKTLGNVPNAIICAVMTFIFGLITTFVDTVFAGGLRHNFALLFGTIYGRGILFYLTHIISNFLIVLFLCDPIKKIVDRSIEKMDYTLLRKGHQEKRNDHSSDSKQSGEKHC